MTEIDYSRFTPDEQERLRTAAFAVEVEAFQDSLVGKYLIARAEDERAAALEELAEVAPADTERIRQLQMVVKRADSFGQWLADALIAGENAELELQGGP